MTQVQKIEIKGFRSLKNIAWEPDRLNVVIGPNGSGKSNLLRALELLRESAMGKLRDAVLAEGGIRQLLWDHRAKQIAWTINVTGKPIGNQTYELVLEPLVRGGGFNIVREVLANCERIDLDKGKKPVNLIERGLNAASAQSDKLQKS